MKANESYHEILKSSALIGGSQVANIVIGIVRIKAMAMLLGPAGFGLFGLYGSIQNLTQSIAGMGINSSGVRQIAEAAGSDDKARIAQTAAVLRRTAIILGLLGAALLLAFSRQISQLTFGSTEHTAAVSLLSIAVFFGLVSGGQGALIQGMRRIADLAKMNVLGAFFGLCAGIPLVYFFGQKGVAPSLVVVAAMSILTSWWYSRKIDTQPAHVTLSQVRQEASALLKLGSAFMASGLMTMGVAYAVRIMVLRRVGFEATGLYQTAWTLGGLYVSFILGAMGANFYPRLTASIHNHPEANRLVNEQTLIGLLLAGPGVLATLTFAPLVIMLFYSAKFGASAELLRWICLGNALQVVTWPMGFIIVAKGNQKLFFLAEFSWTVVAIALAWLCLRWFGLNGAGIAFFGSYVFHLFLIYPISRWMTGFRWSRENAQNTVAFLALMGLVFGGFYVVPVLWATGIGMLATIASAVYSMRVLLRLVPLERVPGHVRRLFVTLTSVLRPKDGRSVDCSHV
ncbi:O-antigen translocase [Tunturiibacter gelidiferens]|uniref:O-antigen translocase n=1 Tax=Tunturiibacter gelidiferens TaxID=3069689 RepID=UPI003D9B4913